MVGNDDDCGGNGELNIIKMLMEDVNLIGDCDGGPNMNNNIGNGILNQNQ